MSARTTQYTTGLTPRRRARSWRRAREAVAASVVMFWRTRVRSARYSPVDVSHGDADAARGSGGNGGGGALGGAGAAGPTGLRRAVLRPRAAGPVGGGPRRGAARRDRASSRQRRPARRALRGRRAVAAGRRAP